MLTGSSIDVIHLLTGPSSVRDPSHLEQPWRTGGGVAVEWTTSNGAAGTLDSLETTTTFEMKVGDREAVGR